MIKKTNKKDNHNSHDEHDHGAQKINKLFWIKTIILAILFAYFAIINIIKPDGQIKWTAHWGIWLPITTYVILFEGPQYFKAYSNIFKKILDMNTLIAFGAHTLYVYSIVMAAINWNAPIFSYEQMWEGTGALIIFTNIGHALEDKVHQSSISAYKKLESLKNSQVTIVRNGKELILPASKTRIGDIMIIKKGDIVPVDGIMQSSGAFDFSNITGESKIVLLKKGQEVISGAFNAENIVKIKISRNPNNSTLSTIIDKIEDVSMARPALQKLADKLLKWFIPIVIGIAFMVFFSYLTIGLSTDWKWPWLKNRNLSAVSFAIEAAMTVIAIACPCALGIATPLVYTVSSLLSAKKGIMVNDPKAFEELTFIKTFAFDKTGTITSEEMDIVKIEGDKKLIGVAKALEKNVKHPIALSILKQSGKFAKVSNIKVKNKFIEGKWNNNKVSIGRYESESLSTNIALYVNGKAKLIFSLENKIKKGVKETIALLKKKGIKTVMITGDHQIIADHIAKSVGIDKVYSDTTPNNKAKIIKDLQKEGEVLFVGDGFNDSIAMKQANISVAFASGSEITNILSDVSILRDDFKAIADLLIISRLNNKEIKISLSYAFGFNLIAIPIAILMLIQPWVGATIMAISDVLVASNAYIYKKIGAKKLGINLKEEKIKEKEHFKHIIECKDLEHDHSEELRALNRKSNMHQNVISEKTKIQK